MDVRVSIDTREVKAALQALKREGPKAIADAMNRTAFEILDELEVEMRAAFPFASTSTTRFLARSFTFDKATEDSLLVRIKQRPASPGFLAEQSFGDLIKASDERLSVGGKLAVPVNVKRGPSGKVPAKLSPQALIEPGGGGFRTPRAIFQRTGPRRVRGTQKSGRLAGTRLMYLLLERPVKLKKRLRFHEVVEKTFRVQFPKKAERVLEKINLRRGR